MRSSRKGHENGNERAKRRTEMREFLAYVEDSSDTFAAGVETDWVRCIHERVRRVKQNKSLEVEFMTFGLLLSEKGDESYAQGMRMGLEQGMEDINRLYGYLLKNNMSTELERSISDAGYRGELLQKYQADGLIATSAGV